MRKYFDESKWAQIVKEDDWYLKLNPEIQQLKERAESAGGDESKEIKREIRDFFEQRLESGEVKLGSSGPDLDEQREPIDTIVIHHTSAAPGYTLSRMNAVQLVNIYVPYFCDPHIQGEEGLKGHPMWSNHFAGGRQVFYVYHWLVRMDGKAEQLLEDKAIGWHAGDWGINKRSVGIGLDNDYTNSTPAPEVLDGLADLIKKNYPDIRPERVFGHREINPKSVSPGNQFIGGWKEQLLERLKK